MGYALFPLLGLWAWGIMWTHYAYGGLRIASGTLTRNPTYSTITMWFVLAFILLHPGILIYEQWSRNDLLPPESFYSFVGPNMKQYVVLGLVALITFLLYDIVLRFKNHRTIQKLWFWISLSQMVAMVLIFIHGLNLGQNLQHGWLQFYWVVLGALLLPCFVLVGIEDWRQHQIIKKTRS